MLHFQRRYIYISYINKNSIHSLLRTSIKLPDKWAHIRHARSRTLTKTNLIATMITITYSLTINCTVERNCGTTCDSY